MIKISIIIPLLYSFLGTRYTTIIIQLCYAIEIVIKCAVGLIVCISVSVLS